jgi:hypothetical protein
VRIPILTEREYDLTSLVASANVEVVLVKALDVTAYRSGTLLVRLHAATWGAGSPTAAVKALMTAPSVDDPSRDFVDGSAKATCTLSSAAAGDLVKDDLDAGFGSHLRIVLDVTQGSPADTLVFTISAEIELSEVP